MAKYTFDQVRSVVEYIVGQNPGFVYAPPDAYGTCSYISEDRKGPGCIVGHVLAVLEPGLLYGEIRNSVIETFSIADPAFKSLDLFDGRTLRFLRGLQYKQDGGESWSSALKIAEDWDRKGAELEAYGNLEN